MSQGFQISGVGWRFESNLLDWFITASISEVMSRDAYRAGVQTGRAVYTRLKRQLVF
jgi:hypothetical protein